jgi:xanthine dehydrogenase accessory factor
MRWLQAVEKLRAGRRPGVLVTLVSVRGRAPRDAGAKMVVAADSAWDSIGGNVEATRSHARALLSA